MHCNISILLLKVECCTVEFDHFPFCLEFNSPFSSGGLPVPWVMCDDGIRLKPVSEL